MNKTFNTLLGAILLAGSANAFAASSVDLTVTGTITPSACTPALSNGGTVDYGKISAKDLNLDKPTPLGREILQLTVACDAATLFALEAKDNRLGSHWYGASENYGLGLINGTEKLGAYTMRLRSLLADGVPSRSIASRNGGLSWYLDGGEFWRDNILSVTDASSVAPIPVQLLTADFRVTPEIAPANQLTLTNEVTIDGSATLTVRYL
jgi:hypothetical protein